MAEGSSASATSRAEVAEHVEALNLTGLSFAVRRLLGRDPKPVTGQFTMWARQGHKGLPAVTSGLWTALAPLEIGRPRHPAAAVCDLVLRGRERDGGVGLKAAGDCAAAGKARFSPLPEGGGDGAAEAKALARAVKDYWRTVGTMYGEVRGPVVAGDLRTAAGRVHADEAALRAAMARIAQLSAAIAARTGAPTGVAPKTPARREPAGAWPLGAAGGSAVPQEDLADVEQTGPLQFTGPLRRQPDDDPDVADPVGARAEAFARQRRLREEPEAVPRPVEVLSTKPVRNHVFLPVLFLLAIAGIALYVIFAVLNAPNPLAQ